MVLTSIDFFIYSTNTYDVNETDMIPALWHLQSDNKHVNEERINYKVWLMAKKEKKRERRSAVSKKNGVEEAYFRLAT